LTKIRLLGQSAVELSTSTVTVVVDPFLTDNPKAGAAPEELQPDVILLTHGHFDHLGDTVAIARRTGAPVLAVHELANHLAVQGLQTFDPNLGGTVHFEWGWVKLVPAWHSVAGPDGVAHIACGLLIGCAGTVVYHLGDTCLFSDLQLVGGDG
jgi:L-ascorbate metabolism protein UlaG (beta-lactamase superfamily)